MFVLCSWYIVVRLALHLLIWHWTVFWCLRGFSGVVREGMGRSSRIQMKMEIKNINTREWKWELTSGNGSKWEYWLCSRTPLPVTVLWRYRLLVTAPTYWPADNTTAASTRCALTATTLKCSVIWRLKEEDGWSLQLLDIAYFHFHFMRFSCIFYSPSSLMCRLYRPIDRSFSNCSDRMVEPV